MAQLIKKSFIDLKNDTIYITKLRVNKKFTKNFSLTEYIRYKQIIYDLIKFIPYSVFLIIPFMELFIPVYMVMFPNALPS